MRLFLVAVFLLAGAPISAEDNETMRLIELSASGVIQMDPEIARIQLSVETSGSTAQLASEANADLMEKVLNKLHNSGLSKESVRTLSYYVNPQYDNSRRGELKPIGFLAKNSIQVKLDSLSLVGQIIDAAISAGANRVTDIKYEVRNPQAAYREALGAAVKQATLQAEVLAAAAGEQLGPVHRIRSSSPIRFAESALKTMAVRGVASTPIESGTLEITATVTMEFQLADK